MKKDRLNNTIASVKTRLGLDRLQKREKKVLGAGGLFIVGFLLFQLAVSPYMKARERLGASVRKNESDLVDMRLLRQEYLGLKEKENDIKARLQRREAEFSLFSFLEEQTDAVDVKRLVTYMKPSRNVVDGGLAESTVEMRLEGIGLGQLVTFLAHVESREKVVAVQRISIHESAQNPGLLEVIVRLMTYEPDSR